MPRKKTIYSDTYPYHVYNRSNNRERFYLDLETLWDIFEDQLWVLINKYKCEIISFVLMPNHYHLLIQTPNANISDAMLEFHRNTSKIANKKANRINHFFGSRFKWSLITSDVYFWNCYKYVRRNPVKAKLCGKVEDYPFSTFVKNLGILSKHCDEMAKDLDWLNSPFLKEQEEAILAGLRRREFKNGRNKSGYLTQFDLPLRGKFLHS